MPPAVTVLLVPASVRPFEAMKGMVPPTRVDECPPRRSDRSALLRPVAVRVGDDFHQVTARIFEIDAAAAVQVIDLARFGAPRVGVIAGAVSADTDERRVELGV